MITTEEFDDLPETEAYLKWMFYQPAYYMSHPEAKQIRQEVYPPEERRRLLQEVEPLKER